MTTSADLDFATIRDASTRELAAQAPSWTDHNLHDPGITILEAALFAVSVLHYRVADRSFEEWPLEITEAAAAIGLDDVVAAAAFLTDAANRETAMDAVQVAAGADEAITAVAALTGSRPAATAIALLARGPAGRRLVLDHFDIAAAAVDRSGAHESGTAAAVLQAAIPALWPHEAAALAGRIRSSQLAAGLEIWRANVPAELAQDPAAVAVAATAAFGPITDAEQLSLLSLLAWPRIGAPEGFEDAEGRTLVWPPATAQGRTVEPVLERDYARLAQALPTVKRAWLRKGVLGGIDWKGAAVADEDPHRRGAYTIVVEPPESPQAPSEAAQAVMEANYLLHVLAATVGTTYSVRVAGTDPEVPELAHPYATPPPNALSPRRLIGDEICAALLDECPVAVRARLFVGIDAPRDDVMAEVRSVLDAYFAAGRREPPRPPELPDGVDGPWPIDVPTPRGWVPGEPIPIHEFIQVLAAVPGVLGVGEAAARIVGNEDRLQWHDAGWHEERVELKPQCIPKRAEQQCVVLVCSEGEGAPCDD